MQSNGPIFIPKQFLFPIITLKADYFLLLSKTWLKPRGSRETDAPYYQEILYKYNKCITSQWFIVLFPPYINNLLFQNTKKGLRMVPHLDFQKMGKQRLYSSERKTYFMLTSMPSQHDEDLSFSSVVTFLCFPQIWLHPNIFTPI